MEIRLQTPVKGSDVKKLKIGDEVLISGTLFTARDMAHKFLIEENFEKINHGIIYHCGPIVKKDNGRYKIISAGPTTSARMNIYMPELIKKYDIPLVIGKGGMDSLTQKALIKYNAVYLTAIGGTGALCSSSIVRVKNVYKPEFGDTEAIWELEVRNFPAIVAMDSHGNSIYDKVKANSKKKLADILGPI
jgi:tartrate/fumarate subfamily iron-sulfur-dependent hydro-lyase beta chain|tara:strand:+ start:46 stop:615 length:570 start_codon:yes stop_codon:yes gene_type:complete